MSKRRYYILIGYNIATQQYELIFGDYDRETVEDERRDILDGYRADDYKYLRVRRTSDDQAAINAAVDTLNT